ncbi:hypothetical protein J7L68_09125 [bacterium]|nr:hypothetical protein [bacterium]
MNKSHIITLVFFLIAGFVLAQSPAQRERIFRGGSFSEDETSAKPKSIWKAVGFSLLIPGAGEMYLGAGKSGIPLTVADGFILSSGAYFAIKRNWLSSEYKTFAAKYACVSIDGKNDDFFRTIGLYPDRYTYNYIQRLYDRDEAITYPETPEWNWVWRDEDTQVRYYDLRTDSERAWRNFKIALGAAAVNRLISVINVIRLSRGGAGWNISACAYPDKADGLGVSVELKLNFDTFKQE